MSKRRRTFSRPTKRSQCVSAVRPCPFVGCKYHLCLDVSRAGRIKLNAPDIPPGELDRMPETCALDVAERGPHTLEEIGHMLQITREGVRLIEERALAKAGPRMARALEMP